MRMVAPINARSIYFLIISLLICILVVRLVPSPGRSRPGGRNVGSKYDPETSCGPVSLAVVSQYLEKPSSVAEFHNLTHAGDLGVCTFTDLIQALSQRDFPVSVSVTIEKGLPVTASR